ncbi:MAG: hypothetical protein E6H08_16165 [Bacteroidetes bacterium]|nr:MAG: hypothetical protein E6H08_16165 [Bacteroidota bacterium]
MLTILLAWIYITFLCWTWGILFLQMISVTKTRLHFPLFSIICITGLSAITVIAGLLSLFFPLGEWWVQFLFIIPCLVLFFQKNSPAFFAALKKEFQDLHFISIILLSVCLLLILVMSSWIVIHPDTLGYHAQTIQWIEKYKAVPGLVHLQVRFGYQGLWFVDNALFGFSFTGNEGITLLNSTVLFWFFIFLTNRINYNFFKAGKRVYGLLWTALLLISTWSYTQVRLTATSASPDFIAALFILIIIYLLLEKKVKHPDDSTWLLAAFLSVVAVTIKLSVAPILLIAAVPAFIGLVKRKIKLFFTIFFISVITLTPFIVRNIITTGYVVFPSTSIDVTHVDWKYNRERTINEKNYITAYAKNPGIIVRTEINAINKMNPAEWLPTWWQNRSTADKIIMTFLVLSFFIALLSIKKILLSGFIPQFVLVTLLTGIIFWFVNAPDPRFGFGSILGFIAVVSYLVFTEKEILIQKSVLIAILLIITGSVLAYTGYRFVNFFKKDQLLKPLGIEKVEYKTFDCDGIKINSPVANKDLGITPIPCTDLDCERFSPRGHKVEDGFRAK